MKTIIRISSLGYLAGIGLSAPLWGRGQRLFPSFAVDRFLVADADFLSNLFELSPVFSSLLIVSLLFLLWRPESRLAQLWLLLLTSLLVVTDVHRLQPWVYQYVATICLAMLAGKSKTQFQSAVLLMLAGTYFYSGVQKLNPIFLLETFPFLLNPLSEYLDMGPWLMALGILIPFVEIALGLGLLFPKLQKFSAVGIIAMHSAILLSLGPLGQNHNSVVWPWNVCMILTVAWLVFGQKLTWEPKYWRCPCVATALGLFFSLPVLSLVGWWPSYLSMSLYSGNTTKASIVFDQQLFANIPQQLQSLALAGQDSKKKIPLVDWSFTTLNIPPFPEQAALRDAAEQLCQQYQLDNARIEISHRLLLFGKQERVETLSCAAAQKQN